jgi:hypothetical protein
VIWTGGAPLFHVFAVCPICRHSTNVLSKKKLKIKRTNVFSTNNKKAKKMSSAPQAAHSKLTLCGVPYLVALGTRFTFKK